MKTTTILLLLISLPYFASNSYFNNTKDLKSPKFDPKKDFLLANFDCKTDVDDLHSVAAFATLMAHKDFSEVKYHAVAGTYGVQEGLYVPANNLFELAFGENWTDAHNNMEAAMKKVKPMVEVILKNEGDIWIAEAGQSDFSALLVKAIQKELPDINTKERIHLVQHSDWNEEVTAPESLKFVKENTDYHKIPDGNAVGNGTPGFRTPGYDSWKTELTDPELLKIWQLAVDLGMKYNGKEDRYNNEAVAAKGVDFSDISETCYILNIKNIKDTEDFFKAYSK